MHQCRCCGSTSLDMVLDLGRQPWGNDFVSMEKAEAVATYPLELFFCNDCKLVQLGHTVPKETMFVDHAYLSGMTRSLKNHFVEVGEDILSRHAIGDDGYVLDIGGNDGTFLEFFAEQGIRVLNVDSGKLQAERSDERGVPCLNAFFNEQTAKRILDTHGRPSVIHGAGIFFHLEELHSVFAGIKSILAPGGLLVAEFIYLPEMVANCAYDQIYHEHLVYYTLGSFGRLLAQHGMEFFDAHLDPIHGGSCIAFGTHAGDRGPTAALKNLIRREKDGGFESIGTYREFADRVRRMGRELTAIVRDLRGQGLRIQAMGAPVKGSTMINYCGFTENDIECAVEINSYKCGTYYPGTRIPVLHEDDVEKPDAYLLLAWNFQQEILEKLESYRAGGGKIIVPIPLPEII